MAHLIEHHADFELGVPNFYVVRRLRTFFYSTYVLLNEIFILQYQFEIKKVSVLYPVQSTDRLLEYIPVYFQMAGLQNY